MQAQTPEVSGEKATTNPIKVGESVSYVAVRSTGRSVQMSTRKGKVERIEGNVAWIRARNGRLISTNLRDVTREGERNALTRALLGSSQ